MAVTIGDNENQAGLREALLKWLLDGEEEPTIEGGTDNG